MISVMSSTVGIDKANRRLLFLLALLFAALPLGVSGGDWPCYGADAQRSHATDEAIELPLQLSWTYKPSQPPRPAWPEPMKEMHRIDFDYCFQPVVSQGMVFFGSSADDAVRALKLSDGQLAWRFATGGPVRFAPLVHNGRCYVPSDDGVLYCLDAKTGGVIWRFKGGPDGRLLIGNERLISRWPLRSGVVLYDNTLYLTVGMWPSEGVFVYALDPETAKILWRNDTSGHEYVYYPHKPAAAVGGVAPQGYCLAGEDVFLVPAGRSLPGGYDRHTGRLLYCNKDVGHRWWAGGSWAAIAEPYFFNTMTLGTFGFSRGHGKPADPVQYDGTVVYQLENGMPAKQRFLRHTYGHSNNSYKLLALGETLYGVTLEEVYRADMSDPLSRSVKRRIWETPFDADRAFELALAAGHLLIGGRGYVRAYDAATGDKKWEERIDGEARGMAVAGGRLVVDTHRGDILCYAPAGESKAPTVIREQASAGTDFSPDKVADQIADRLIQEKMTRGFALVVGQNDTRVAETLVNKTELRVIQLAADAARRDSLRKDLLSRTSLNGFRISVLAMERLADLPDDFANIAVAASAPDEALLASLRRVLHPYTGQMFVPDRQNAKRILRMAAGTPPPDQPIEPPFEILWFGGPGPGKMSDRHIVHTPRPKAANGRYFIIGEHDVLGVDAFNGVELWSIPIHDACVRDWLLKSADKNVFSDVISMLVGDAVVRLDLEAGVNVDLDARDGDVIGYYGLQPSRKRFALNKPRSFKLPYGASGDDELDKVVDAALTGGKVEEAAEPPLSGEITLSSSAEGIEVKLGANHQRPSLWDRWQLYFDFRPEGERHGLYGPGAFQITVYPKTTYTKRDTFKFHMNYPRAIKFAPKPPKNEDVWTREVYWLPGAGPIHPDLKLSGTREENRTATRVVIPWKDLEGMLESRPTAFGFAADLTALSAIDDQDAIEISLFADAAAPRANNGWPVFDLAAKTDGLITPKPDDSAFRSLDAAPEIQDHVPPEADTVYKEFPKFRVHPLTGEYSRRLFRPSYGCAAPVSTGDISFFRSATLSFHDYADDSGVRSIPGVRPGCTDNSSVLPAMGIVICSERSSGCTCAYNFQTSLALKHTDRHSNEDWAIFYDMAADAPVRSMNLNIGVPGDRRDAEGRLWLGFPRPDPKWRPALVVSADIRWMEGMGPYHFNSDFTKVTGTDRPWLFASGCAGITQLVLRVDNPLKVSCPFTGKPPIIDGKLDELMWDQTTVTNRVPLRYTPSSIYYREYWDHMRQEEQMTDWCTVRHDKDNLYFGFHNAPELDRRGRPLKLRIVPAERDDRRVFSGHYYTLFITDPSREIELQFGVSASGAKYDARCVPPPGEKDVSWNGEWEAATVADDMGFRVEIALPFDTLKKAGIDPTRPMVNLVGRTPPGTFGPASLRFPGRYGFDYCENFVPIRMDSRQDPDPKGFSVRLYFAEYRDVAPGQSRFDVRIQGKTVLPAFDIMKEAGGKWTAVSREFKGIPVEDKIVVDFVPRVDAPDATSSPILSAIEILDESFDWKKAAGRVEE